jgi:cation-transporting P-type ATPase I
MPLRAVAAGVQATTSLVEAGITIGAIPLREGVRAISGELPGEKPATLSRRCWRGQDRAWIEVRGLDGAAGDELGRGVLDAVLAHPGVVSAGLNYPLSRVVVTIGDAHTSLRDLCRIVGAAETRCTPIEFVKPVAPPTSLPGDGVVLATRAATAAASAAGLGIALTGRALRWPRMPIGVLAGVVALDYQPRLRRLLEDRIGRPATDTVLALAVTAAETVTLSPASLSVGLLMQSLKAAECRAEARAWVRHEPQLASHADHPRTDPSAASKPPRGRPADHHADRFALLQAISAGIVGATTRNLNQAALAVLVTTPAANRTTP